MSARAERYWPSLTYNEPSDASRVTTNGATRKWTRSQKASLSVESASRRRTLLCTTRAVKYVTMADAATA